MVKRMTAAVLALSLLTLCGSGTALAAAPDADSESSTSDALVDQQWALSNHGGKREVVIAPIDTGADSSHEDLQGILWIN